MHQTKGANEEIRTRPIIIAHPEEGECENLVTMFAFGKIVSPLVCLEEKDFVCKTTE
jgi:hypothetical protein